MRCTTTVVVGAGHSGLAMSRCLAERSVDHVVLERGEVAHSWRARRDSLRLLTPTWMTRLPGLTTAYDDPDGYLAAPEVTRLIQRYAVEIAAPVVTGAEVTSVRPHEDGYAVRTSRGTWHARTVVVASGAATVPSVPSQLASCVPADVVTATAATYRTPDQLPAGGVLVVGASASGVQIAEELQRSGRPVTLAVGEHVRVPRTYRGRDVMWWLDASGLLDERFDETPDLVRARNVPSMQLIGTPGRTLDLNTLSEIGVRLVGRLAGVDDRRLLFSGSLPNVCALADLKLARLLDTFDAWAARTGVGVDDPSRPAPTVVPAPALSATTGPTGIGSVVWATGLRPDLGYLDADVRDARGRLVHHGGVTRSPGLYVMGLPFLRRRRSTFIDGAGADAHELADHLVDHLRGAACAVAHH